MPECIILIGLPGSGKSTYVKNNLPNHAHLSMDGYIDDYAELFGITYTESFDLYVEYANKLFRDDVQRVITNRNNFVVDRTNMSVKSRKSILAQLPKHYTKIAYVFNRVINLDRPGKEISIPTLKKFVDMYEPPTEEEFDIIKEIII